MSASATSPSAVHSRSPGEGAAGRRKLDISLENAPRLRKFIHGGGTQEAPTLVHARVVLGGLDWASIVFGFRNHRAELEYAKDPATEAHTVLREGKRGRRRPT